LPPIEVTVKDRDPVDWTGRAPQNFPIHGIDAARFQDEIDWHEVHRAGIRFAYIKATEGGDLLDPAFKDHWRGAARAGVARGAYHFYYFCTSAADQARWFIRNVPRRKGALPPVLDMEWNPFSPTCKKRPAGEVVRSEMQIFLRLLERHYGQRPMIYTTPQFYRDAGLGRLKGEEFWLRSTAKTPGETFPGQAWTFWQYSGTGHVPGVAGDVDLNTFYGTHEMWVNWLAKRQL
jgi:lysozyme